jgi:hypothetical protein
VPEVLELAGALWKFCRAHLAACVLGFMLLLAGLQLSHERHVEDGLRVQLAASQADASQAHAQLDAMATQSAARAQVAAANLRAAEVTARSAQAQAKALLDQPHPPAGADLCKAAQAMIADTIAKDRP